MAKFSIIEIVDWRPNFTVALSILIQGCMSNDENCDIFSKSYQLSATKKGETVLKDLSKYLSNSTIRGDDILVVVGHPDDMELSDFEERLVPFVKQGVKLLVVNETGFSPTALAKFSDSVAWLRFTLGELNTTLSTNTAIQKVLMKF